MSEPSSSRASAGAGSRWTIRLRAGKPANEVVPAGQKAIPAWAKIGYAGGILAPFLVLAGLVNRFGVNVPYSDQWELVPLLQKSRGPGLGLSDLLAQHGEQRMFFPRLIMVGLAPLTGWNIRVEMFLNLALAAGIAAILLTFLFRTLRELGGWLSVPLASSSLLIFSPVQSENWLWGWAISWYLPLFCFSAAAAIFSLWPDKRPLWPALTAAAVAAMIGQYSLFSGTLIWVCCLPILAVKRGMGRHIAAWVGMGAASTALYLRGRQPSHWEEFYASWPSVLQNPIPAARYLLFYLSRPVLDEEPGYLAGGLFLIAFLAAGAYLMFFQRERLQAAVVWVSIGCFALLWAIMTMFGRLGLGLHNAGASRYTTVSILFMISTLALVSLAIAPAAGTAASRAAVTWTLAAWLTVAFAFLADYGSEVAAMEDWHDQRVEAKQCLLTAISEQDPCLDMVYPNRLAVFERAAFLRSMRWGGLAKVSGPQETRLRHPMQDRS